MKHKKLRTVLITVVVIAALVAAYMIAFMRPQPLLDCLGGTEAPTTGTLTVYDQAHQEGQKWDVALTKCGRPCRAPRSAFCGATAW